MKIIYKDAEFGYQQPIINNIDVLLDVTNRTSGIADGTTLALNNTISGYERLIISIWTANSTAGIKWAKYVKTNEVAVSDILADASFTVPMITVWDLSNGNYGNVEFDSSTYKSVTVHKGSNVGIGRIKIEGVKRTAQVSNLDTWEDITSKCTFANGFTSSNTKVYANPLFIYIGHYGNNGTRDNVLSITLPSGYEAFGCLAGNHLRNTWSGAGAITSASNSSMVLGKGRYIWIGQPSGDSGNGILGGILVRNV